MGKKWASCSCSDLLTIYTRSGAGEQDCSPIGVLMLQGIPGWLFFKARLNPHRNIAFALKWTFLCQNYEDARPGCQYSHRRFQRLMIQSCKTLVEVFYVHGSEHCSCSELGSHPQTLLIFQGEEDVYLLLVLLSCSPVSCTHPFPVCASHPPLCPIRPVGLAFPGAEAFCPAPWHKGPLISH